jgi:hypothetical protein
MPTAQPVKTGNCGIAGAGPSRHDARSWDTRDPGLAQETASSRPPGDDVRHIRHFPGYQESSELEGSHAVVAELKPTPREHDDIMSEAGRISRNLRRVLRAQEPKQ